MNDEYSRAKYFACSKCKIGTIFISMSSNENGLNGKAPFWVGAIKFEQSTRRMSIKFIYEKIKNLTPTRTPSTLRLYLL
jgi:hypothetical protein